MKTMLEEMVKAQTAATTALENCNRALASNSEMMEKHHETVMVMNRFWEDLCARINAFECPYALANPKPVTPKTQGLTVTGDKN